MKVIWYDESRKRCCDTKWFIKTYAPKHLVKPGQYIEVSVFTCDIAFSIWEPWNDPCGEYTRKFIRNCGMLEFFTS